MNPKEYDIKDEEKANTSDEELSAEIEAQAKREAKAEAAQISNSGLFWLTCWFLLNIGLTLMNKSLFQFGKFNFPLALSLVHMIFSSGMSRLTLKVSICSLKFK